MRVKFGVLEQTRGVRLHAKFRLERFILSPSGGEKIPNVFYTSAFCGVAIWRRSEKVEHGCPTTNFPLSNGIKIVSVLQRLHGEIGRTNSDVQQRDGQTDKQKRLGARLRRRPDPLGSLQRSPRSPAWENWD